MTGGGGRAKNVGEWFGHVQVKSVGKRLRDFFGTTSNEPFAQRNVTDGGGVVF